MFWRKNPPACIGEGFYGEHFREFADLGLTTVRHMYEANLFPDPMRHRAAGVWLGRREAAANRRANLLSYAALSISMLSLLVALLKR